MKTFKGDPVSRALAAYYRGSADVPPVTGGDLVERDGRSYVILRNGGGVVAVYRVQNSGQLKSMKYWPKELEEGLV